jgi:hypothetical protein
MEYEYGKSILTLVFGVPDRFLAALGLGLGKRCYEATGGWNELGADTVFSGYTGEFCTGSLPVTD